MTTLAFLLALVTLPARQDPTQQPDPNLKQYQSLTLGLKFSYPKEWELTINKKGEGRLLIPMESTSDRAVVEILPVNFRSEPNVWQLTQVAINKTWKREIERQWDEEILGVPLLLTKVNYTDKGTQKTAETGLIYSLGFNKMMYRITASPAEFDKADYMWRQVLQSLRTWDGSLPKVEDQSKIERKDPKTIIKPGKDDDLGHPQVPHEISGTPKVKLVKAPSAAAFQLGETKLELRVPSDWKVASDKAGVFTLTSPAVSAPVMIKVYAVAGSDPTAMALFKASGESLNDFTKVTKRDEALPAVNRAGAAVGQIWRAGSGAKGDVFTCEASIQGADCYGILTYRVESAQRWGADRRAIEQLLERISIEPAP